MRGYHRVPARLKIRLVETGKTTFTTLELISAGPATDDLYDDVKRARLPADPASRLGRLIRRSLDPGERDRLPGTAADYAARYKMAAEQGLYTDAMLIALECHLQMGEETDRAIDALLPYTPTHPDLGNFLAALTLADNRATVDKSLEALSKVNRDLLLRKHLYDFALANALAQTGKYRQAEDLFFVASRRIRSWRGCMSSWANSTWKPAAWKTPGPAGTRPACSARPTRCWKFQTRSRCGLKPANRITSDINSSPPSPSC
jgi:hypothetical protein